MTDNASDSAQSHRRGQGSAPPGGSGDEGVGGEVHEPPALCCPVLQTIFRDPVFVPESGNTYDRQALEMFWLASRRAGAQPRDPLNNTVLSTTQVFINWDKRREVNAWLQENPQYIPKGWASHEDMVPAEAHGGGRTLGGGAGRGNQADPHHRHVHLQLDLNVHLSARQIGIFAVVAMSLFYCIVCVLWLWPPQTRLCPARTAQQWRQQQSRGLLQPSVTVPWALCHTPYQYQCQRAVD